MTRLHYTLVSKVFNQEDVASGIKVLNSKNITMEKFTKNLKTILKRH